MAFKEARCRSDEVQWILHQGGPWQLADLEEQRALMGENFQPYGYRENRQMVAAFCEEVLAQGLIREPINPDILFAEFEEMTR